MSESESSENDSSENDSSENDSSENDSSENDSSENDSCENDSSENDSCYASKDTVSTFYNCVEYTDDYVNYSLYMLIPLLIIIAAWFICGMDEIYHNACMIALVTALLFFGVFTWK